MTTGPLAEIPKFDSFAHLSDDALDTALFQAHEAGDRAALVAIYATAAGRTQDLDLQAFLITQAYVFALEIDHPAARPLHAKLVSLGREAPIDL